MTPTLTHSQLLIKVESSAFVFNKILPSHLQVFWFAVLLVGWGGGSHSPVMLLRNIACLLPWILLSYFVVSLVPDNQIIRCSRVRNANNVAYNIIEW